MKVKTIHYRDNVPYREIDIALNLAGIPNRPVKYGTKEAFDLTDEQEQFVKKELKRVFPNLDWKTTQEFLGGEFNTEANRILGDIVAVHPITGELICIDVKVCIATCENNRKTGTIAYSSLSGFAKYKNHYYLSITKDGSDYIMVPASDIYNIYCKTKCLMPVEDEKTRLRYNIDSLKYLTSKKPAFSSDKDYIPSFIFYPRYMK